MPKKGESEPKYHISAANIKRLCPKYTGMGGVFWPSRTSEESVVCETPKLGTQNVYVKESDGVSLTRVVGGINKLELECGGCVFAQKWNANLRKKLSP